MTFGPITSILIRNYGYRAVMMTGGAICTFSVVVSSFATSIPQLFLSFSLLYGIGTCMATGPTMTITTVYFDKYLTIATGFTVSGSSFGTLVMGPLSQIIIDTLGWRNAFRIFAGLHIITIILNSQIKAPVVYNKTVQKKRSLLLDFQIWKNRVFVVWTLAITLVMFGFYIPYVHLVSMASTTSNKLAITSSSLRRLNVSKLIHICCRDFGPFGARDLFNQSHNRTSSKYGHQRNKTWLKKTFLAKVNHGHDFFIIVCIQCSFNENIPCTMILIILMSILF